MGHQAQATKRKSDLDRKEWADEGQKIKKLENYPHLKVPDDLSVEVENEETSIPGTLSQTDLTLKYVSVLISHQDFAVEKMKKLQSKVETSFFGLMEDTKKHIAKWTYYTGLQQDIVQSIYEEVKMYIPSTSTT